MLIAIASDHAALDLKTGLVDWLRSSGHDVIDVGAALAADADYADQGFALADHVGSGQAERGVALCGSGVGIAIAVNRHPACRCALVSDPETAALSRQHNDANVIAMGARRVDFATAKACVEAFLGSEFSGGRHSARIAKLGATPLFKVVDKDSPRRR